MLPFFPYFNEKEKEKKDERPLVYEELPAPTSLPKEVKPEEKIKDERGVTIIEVL